jgi:branched-chain amino acid transport system ATP-binding protein
MNLEVRGLNAGYGGIPVVRDLELDVGDGEIVALLGPNGAGKTTTLLAIAGCLRPMSGEVLIDRASAVGVAPYKLVRKGLAFIADDRCLLPSLTVAENLALVRRRSRDPLKLFPTLESLMSRRAGLLSGGEQQMLALARAFSAEPKLLLIDELSQGLAPLVLEHLFPMLQLAVREWGASVLLVEQNVSEALRIADRGYVLHHGTLAVAGDSAGSLLERRDIVESAYLGDSALRT